MRVAVVACAIGLSIVGLAQGQSAKAAIRVPTNIPAQGLGPALKAFAQERNLQVLYFSRTVNDLRTGGAVGELTADEALTQLLSGTGLSYEYVDDKAVTILPAGAQGGALPTKEDDPNVANASKEGKKSASGEFRLAQVAPTTPRAAVTSGIAEARQPVLEEVVVTAQKREERLQDVPVPVTAISADTLLNSNQVRLQDYYTSIPALSVVPFAVNGAPNIAIRGVTSGAGIGNPTVGITVDDVPYGSSTSLGGGAIAPDLDPSDLQRVEVLRGPQGTLYGASSIGGLLKFVTVDPSTDGLSGRVQADVNSIHNGDGSGYGFRAAANVPLSSTLAIRVSGFARRDPGYVDNVLTGQDGVNWSNSDGGRFSALWRPVDSLTVKLSALLQHSTVHGSSEVDPTLGDLKQNFIRDVGETDRESQVYNANIKATFGSVEVTSVTGYGRDSRMDSFDLTPLFAQGVAQPIFGVSGSPEFEHTKTSKFSQELRLSTPIGQWFDWLVGGFYTHESSPYNQSVAAVDTNTNTTVGWGENNSWQVTYAEYAAFTDLTAHITDQFDIQFGGRESENRQTYTETDTGPYIDAFFYPLVSPILYPEVHTKQNSFTYLVTPKYQFSPDLMLYARLASGYRPGGPNPTASAIGLPLLFQPDKTKNYEIGVKGDWPGHALSFDVSAYYIDWKNIQVAYALPPSYFSYFANGSGAKSEGVELSVDSKPLTGLTLSGWLAWNEAVLTEGLPPGSLAVASAGDRLPYSSRFSGNISAEQEFALAANVTGFVGGSVSYFSNRQGEFGNVFSADRQIYPGYARTDLRAGVKYDSWSANLYANNVADKRAALSGGIGNYNPAVFRYLQPRTIGLSVSKQF